MAGATLLLLASASHGPCASGLTAMAHFTYRGVALIACEDLTDSVNASIQFIPATSPASSASGSTASPSAYPLLLKKRLCSNLPIDGDDDKYLDNLTKHDVMNASFDIMGARLLANRSNLTLARVWDAMPPLRHLGSWGGGGARVWTGSRGAAVDAVVDETANNHLSGMPSPASISKRLPGLASTRFDREGLLGALPIPLLQFPINGTRRAELLSRFERAQREQLKAALASAVADGRYADAAALQARLLSASTTTTEWVANGSNEDESSSSSWEMSIVPIPNGTGLSQPVYVRFLQLGGGSAAARPLYYVFNSMQYVPNACGNGSSSSSASSDAADAFAGCFPLSDYYQAVLDNHLYWQDTWRDEGRLHLSLPSRPADTDGDLLLRQAHHALLLDMITRVDHYWPRYGTAPGYEQPGIGANGFQDIFTSTMMGALEWGLFPYAKGVLSNWLTYYQFANGGVLYRGLEMPMQGRLLTIVAAYYRYTRDASTVLAHLTKIDGVATMLLTRRAHAIALYPNKTDPRRGMPTGNDEADLFWASTGGAKTQLAFISIPAEAWRGLRDCGEALNEMAAALPPSSPEAKAAMALSARMLQAAPALLSDFRKSMAMSAFKFKQEEGGGTGGEGATVCHPYVFGVQTCDQLPLSAAGSDRASEAWRTYAEAMYAGAISSETIRELWKWHQTARAPSGSRLKLGILTGSGIDVASGDVLETFTLAGWGYGLILADLIDEYLMQYYAMVSHGYTRGTWIAPESSYVNRTQQSPSFATPAGLISPLYLKWALVFEDPQSRTLWLGKATPPEWLSEGETVEMAEAPTAYGRVGLWIHSRVESARTVGANLTLPAVWAADAGRAPRGGIVLRLRVPGARAGAVSGKKDAIVSVQLKGGMPWHSFRGCDIMFDRAALTTPGMLERLADVVVGF